MRRMRAFKSYERGQRCFKIETFLEPPINQHLDINLWCGTNATEMPNAAGNKFTLCE
ncbi:hypothetical protein OKW41_005620 [Paraburkholderia sp. UCT70]